MGLEDKKIEILHNIKTSDGGILSKIKQELSILETTEGINGINNLESFYNIWKNNFGKKGHKNEINSWTYFYLGLTNEKPNGEFLPFRRAFARAGLPDIDSDFDYFRRDEMYEYLKNKYGEERVANIGTHSLIKLKSAIRRIGKALDVANAFHKGPKDNKTLNEAKVTEIIESLPKNRGAFIKVNDENGEVHIIKTIEDAYKYCPDFRKYIDKIPNFREYAKNIEGLISNTGIHASGIVLSNIPLCRIAPLKMSKKGLATQYPYEDLEAVGLIKLDILGISTLTVIQQTIEMIYKNYGIKIDIDKLPLDDKKTFDLYKTGNLTGVFQCEGRGMQETIVEMEVSCLDDISAAIALYRPGPMVSIPEYCARKKRLKNVDYFHPSIEKFVKKYLEDTYGIAVYQEQIMQICNSLAGFSVLDGYVMIKGIGKKKQEIIDKYKKQFISGGKKNGVPENVIEQYWERFIKPFASYGFNKSHCLSGEMRVKDKTTGKFYKIEDLEKDKCIMFRNIVLDSYKDGEIVEDGLVDVFETGEKDIYEIELSNGMKVKGTLDHKFYCTDKREYTVKEIIKNNFEILYKKDEGISSNEGNNII